MTIRHTPVPELFQNTLSLWLFSHLEELRAVCLPFGVRPEDLTTPQWTISINVSDDDDGEGDTPAPVPAPTKPTPTAGAKALAKARASRTDMDAQEQDA